MQQFHFREIVGTASCSTSGLAPHQGSVRKGWQFLGGDFHPLLGNPETFLLQ